MKEFVSRYLVNLKRSIDYSRTISNLSDQDADRLFDTAVNDPVLEESVKKSFQNKPRPDEGLESGNRF